MIYFGALKKCTLAIGYETVSVHLLDAAEKTDCPTDNVEKESYEYRNANQWKNRFNDITKSRQAQGSNQGSEINHSIGLPLMFNITTIIAQKSGYHTM